MSDQLDLLVPAFQKASTTAVQQVLCRNTKPGGPWTVVPRVANPSDLGVSLGFSSEGWQAICTIGTSELDATRLLPPDMAYDEDLLLDALGETTNQICGLLMGDHGFSSEYGELVQSPPIFFRRGLVCPRAWGVVGFLEIEGGARLLCGFAIREVRVFSPSSRFPI